MADDLSYAGSADASSPDEPPDELAARVVALVQAYCERRLAEGDTQPRSFARQMTICALLLDRKDPRGREVSLGRIVRALRSAAARTPAALTKTASEARAILQYGVVDAKAPNHPSVETDDDMARYIAAIDWMLMSVKPREVLLRRAEDLSGRRGGRPAKRVFRVLSAVARLHESADMGDSVAEAELRLVRSFLSKA